MVPGIRPSRVAGLTVITARCGAPTWPAENSRIAMSTMAMASFKRNKFVQRRRIDQDEFARRRLRPF